MAQDSEALYDMATKKVDRRSVRRLARREARRAPSLEGDGVEPREREGAGGCCVLVIGSKPTRIVVSRG